MQLFKRKTKLKTRVGVAVSAERLAIAHLESRNSGPYLLDCQMFPLESSQDFDAVLEKAVKEMELEDTACSYVLSPRDYSLQLVEAPNVEPEEMKQAVRWKVKDLLDMKVEEAAIDVFPVPEDAYRGRQMVYVVATARNRIQQLASSITEAGLELAVIDIPELCMKNIANHCLDDSNGIAFMDLRRTGSTMNITHEGDLYLTRRINTQLDQDVMQSADWDSLKDRLVLEIQRSLDYYESQMSKGQINRIVISPRQHDSKEMARALDESLAQQVTSLTVGDFIQSDVPLTMELQQVSIAAIGATLRGLERAEKPAAPDPEQPQEQEAA